MYKSYALAARSPSERFDSFKGLVEQMFCPMELDSSRFDRDRFHAHVDVANLRTIRLVRVASNQIMVRRRAQDIARICDPPYLVKFQLKGESIWSQRGRQVHARPGDFVICSTAEPYTLAFRGEYEMPVLAIPESTMRRLTPDPEQFLGLRMPGEDVDCGLLSSFVAQVVARLPRLPEPMINRIEANVLDLLGAVLAVRARPSTISREQLLSQVKAYIHDHLHDRHLGPATLAQEFLVSVRLIHTLFENEPMTVGKYIRSLRVRSCRQALESCDTARISLTDLALQWGFYDLSHMSRSFREVYGEPPSSFLQHKSKL